MTCSPSPAGERRALTTRSEEHTSELQSLRHLVCRLLLEKKNFGSPGERQCLDPGLTNQRPRPRPCAPSTYAPPPRTVPSPPRPPRLAGSSRRARRRFYDL